MKSIYNVTFRDIDTTGFILLKHRYPFSFKVGDCYIADKIKLVLNAKAELVLKATSLTVLREDKGQPMQQSVQPKQPN